MRIRAARKREAVAHDILNLHIIDRFIGDVEQFHRKGDLFVTLINVIGYDVELCRGNGLERQQMRSLLLFAVSDARRLRGGRCPGVAVLRDRIGEMHHIGREISHAGGLILADDDEIGINDSVDGLGSRSGNDVPQRKGPAEGERLLLVRLELNVSAEVIDRNGGFRIRIHIAPQLAELHRDSPRVLHEAAVADESQIARCVNGRIDCLRLRRLRHDQCQLRLVFQPERKVLIILHGRSALRTLRFDRQRAVDRGVRNVLRPDSDQIGRLEAFPRGEGNPAVCLRTEDVLIPVGPVPVVQLQILGSVVDDIEPGLHRFSGNAADARMVVSQNDEGRPLRLLHEEHQADVERLFSGRRIRGGRLHIAMLPLGSRRTPPCCRKGKVIGFARGEGLLHPGLIRHRILRGIGCQEVQIQRHAGAVGQHHFNRNRRALFKLSDLIALADQRDRRPYIGQDRRGGLKGIRWLFSSHPGGIPGEEFLAGLAVLSEHGIVHSGQGHALPGRNHFSAAAGAPGKGFRAAPRTVGFFIEGKGCHIHRAGVRHGQLEGDDFTLLIELIRRNLLRLNLEHGCDRSAPQLRKNAGPADSVRILIQIILQILHGVHHLLVKISVRPAGVVARVPQRLLQLLDPFVLVSLLQDACGLVFLVLKLTAHHAPALPDADGPVRPWLNFDPFTEYMINDRQRPGILQTAHGTDPGLLPLGLAGRLLRHGPVPEGMGNQRQLPILGKAAHLAGAHLRAFRHAGRFLRHGPLPEGVGQGVDASLLFISADLADRGFLPRRRAGGFQRHRPLAHGMGQLFQRFLFFRLAGGADAASLPLLAAGGFLQHGPLAPAVRKPFDHLRLHGPAHGAGSHMLPLCRAGRPHGRFPVAPGMLSRGLNRLRFRRSAHAAGPGLLTVAHAGGSLGDHPATPLMRAAGRQGLRFRSAAQGTGPGLLPVRRAGRRADRDPVAPDMPARVRRGEEHVLLTADGAGPLLHAALGAGGLPGGFPLSPEVVAGGGNGSGLRGPAPGTGPGFLAVVSAVRRPAHGPFAPAVPGGRKRLRFCRAARGAGPGLDPLPGAGGGLRRRPSAPAVPGGRDGTGLSVTLAADPDFFAVLRAGGRPVHVPFVPDLLLSFRGE